MKKSVAVKCGITPDSSSPKAKWRMTPMNIPMIIRTQDSGMYLKEVKDDLRHVVLVRFHWVSYLAKAPE